MYNKYAALAADIYAAGRDHEWSDADAWTQEMQDGYWATLDATWTDDVQAIVDYVVANYLNDDYAAMLNVTAADIAENDGLKVAFGMTMWGFGGLNDDGLFAGGKEIHNFCKYLTKAIPMPTGLLKLLTPPTFTAPPMKLSSPSGALRTKAWKAA